MLGDLDHHKFVLVGARESLVRVGARRVRAVEIRPRERVVCGRVTDVSFRLAESGSVDDVRLAGNLTQAAEVNIASLDEPLVRVNLAAEGSGGKTHYFLLRPGGRRRRASTHCPKGRGEGCSAC